MRFFSLLLLVSLALTPMAYAYPDNQLKECLLGAKSNPSILGAPETSIEGFCDCALTEIIDLGNDPDSSARRCVKKFFR